MEPFVREEIEYGKTARVQFMDDHSDLCATLEVAELSSNESTVEVVEMYGPEGAGFWIDRKDAALIWPRLKRFAESGSIGSE